MESLIVDVWNLREDQQLCSWCVGVSSAVLLVWERVLSCAPVVWACPDLKNPVDRLHLTH